MEPGREDQVKEAFHKVRRDMDFLNSELLSLKEDIRATRREMVKICEIIERLVADMEKGEKETKEALQIPIPTYPALQQINQAFPTQNPTQNMFLEPKTGINKLFSTGNEGVPTDRQTDRQT
ncbi:MAG: hypothetical protein AABX71_02060, partial [Nanoarchaeota archaeon]